MSMLTVEELVKRFDLQPHPEGGYFKETYRAKSIIKKEALPDTFAGDRNYSTAIYFLLPEGTTSHLHRIQADELWHFYLGGPLTIAEIDASGNVQTAILGQNIKSGHLLQHLIPAGHWFGAYPNPGTPYSFVGCTVAPGFDFADFELAQRGKLLQEFPQAKQIIEKLT